MKLSLVYADLLGGLVILTGVGVLGLRVWDLIRRIWVRLKGERAMAVVVSVRAQREVTPSNGPGGDTVEYVPYATVTWQGRGGVMHKGERRSRPVAVGDEVPIVYLPPGAFGKSTEVEFALLGEWLLGGEDVKWAIVSAFIIGFGYLLVAKVPHG